MSSITELINSIKVQAEKANLQDVDSKRKLEDLFEEALQLTMQEIKRGADSSSFSELVIVNFIILSSREGYEAYQIRELLEVISPTGFSDSLPPLEDVENEYR